MRDAVASDKSFLGREFLTWLWYRCEVDGGTFPLEGGEVGVVFNDYVSLVSDGEEREENICRRGSPHRSREARTALFAGKLVSAAKLEIARGERQFAARLDARTFDVRGAKYPDPESSEPEERALERLEAMEELSDILDGLYGLFLSVRLGDQWESREVPAMARWIRARGREAEQ
jgi:hypothetical protein